MPLPRFQRMLPALILLALAAGGSPCWSGEERPGPERKFRFLAMADPHWRDRTKYPQGLDGFKTFLEQSKALGADFLVILGDICGEDPPALAQARKIADESGATVHFVHGNHDKPEDFQKAVGKMQYPFDHKGWHFVNFDSIKSDAA